MRSGRQFADLDTKGQAEALRSFARKAFRGFGLDPKRVQLIFHGFNTTFRIWDDSRKSYALRMNVHSQTPIHQLEAETTWVSALREHGTVAVAEPIRTADGGFTVTTTGPSADPIHSVLYGWLPGRVAFRVVSAAVVRQLGQASAGLHRQAASWTLPTGIVFRPLAGILYGQPVLFPLEPPFDSTYERGRAIFERMSHVERIPIHYDLHLGNAKFWRGSLSIFDFEDMVLAWPIIDAAVSLHSIRRMPEPKSLEAAYWEGLGAGPEEHGLTKEEFETLVACRGLFMLNYILGSSHPEVVRTCESQMEATRRRLLNYESTGFYDPSL